MGEEMKKEEKMLTPEGEAPQTEGVIAETLKGEVSAEVKPVYKPSFKERTRPWLFGTGGFLLGALLIFVAFYVPENTRFNWATSEVERLKGVESQYAALQTQHAKLQDQTLVYKLLTNTSVARIAVLDNDSKRIDQVFAFIESGLNSLVLPSLPNAPANLQAQFAKVKGALASNRLTAIDELQTLFNDLLLLANNLE